MIRRYKKIWYEEKLTDLLTTELVIWRRILQPEDFETLSYQKIREAQKKMLAPSNQYLLADF